MVEDAQRIYLAKREARATVRLTYVDCISRGTGQLLGEGRLDPLKLFPRAPAHKTFRIVNDDEPINIHFGDLMVHCLPPYTFSILDIGIHLLPSWEASMHENRAKIILGKVRTR